MSKPNFVYVTYIATTPEKIWQALTDTEVVRQYWVGMKAGGRAYDNLSDWRPGSRWEQQRVDDTRTVCLVGKVLESTPPRRLVLTWASPEGASDPERNSRVTFDIEPHGDRMVKLTVLHEDLDPEMHKGVSIGWPQVLSN